MCGTHTTHTSCYCQAHAQAGNVVLLSRLASCMHFSQFIPVQDVEQVCICEVVMFYGSWLCAACWCILNKPGMTCQAVCVYISLTLCHHCTPACPVCAQVETLCSGFSKPVESKQALEYIFHAQFSLMWMETCHLQACCFYRSVSYRHAGEIELSMNLLLQCCQGMHAVLQLTACTFTLGTMSRRAQMCTRCGRCIFQCGIAHFCCIACCGCSWHRHFSASG